MSRTDRLPVAPHVHVVGIPDIAGDEQGLADRAELGLQPLAVISATGEHATAAPSSTNLRAVASPIPLVAPVTNATFPSSIPMSLPTIVATVCLGPVRWLGDGPDLRPPARQALRRPFVVGVRARR